MSGVCRVTIILRLFAAVSPLLRFVAAICGLTPSLYIQLQFLVHVPGVAECASSGLLDFLVDVARGFSTTSIGLSYLAFIVVCRIGDPVRRFSILCWVDRVLLSTKCGKGLVKPGFISSISSKTSRVLVEKLELMFCHRFFVAAFPLGFPWHRWPFLEHFC